MTEPRFDDSNGRSTVVLARDYPHPIDRVWRAVTQPEHLGQWFPSSVEVDLRPGGPMRFADFEGSAAAAGRIEAIDPPRRLAFTWGTDHLAFDLAPSADGSGTTFTLTHTFDDRSGAASFATGWEHCLLGLASVVAGEPVPAPGAWDRGIDRHEALVRTFGLDQPVVDRGRDGGGGWTVRWERQLTCPADVAWELWFGSDLPMGALREVEPHRVLAFDVAPGGGPGEHVRWELGEGTGHGVRISLTVRGSGDADLEAAVDRWGQGAIGHLARCAAAWAKEQVPA